MLEHIIYASKSVVPLPLDIKDILAASRRNNPPAGITGALCFIDGTYLQYLEGEPAALAALYQKIEADPRHREARVLARGSVSERLFADWSMALLTFNDETRAIVRALVDGSDDVYSVKPDRAAHLMSAFAASANWKTVQ